MIQLFEQYPLLKEKIPYVQLGEVPTPIKHLRNLGKEIGTDYLYLKHDGLSSSIYGGNKIRKLEFLIGDALHKGVKEVLTFGFAGSNHSLATAVYAQKLGLKSVSILLAQPNAQYVRRNLLLSHVCGAEIHHFKNEMAAYIPTTIIFLRKKIKQGKFPYIIGPGGSSPLGTIGYVNAGFEPERVELIPKDMEHDGESGLAGWIRTTWMPFTERIPEDQRDQFINELISAYIHQVPLDTNGKAHVAMVRLEVEAIKNASQQVSISRSPHHPIS